MDQLDRWNFQFKNLIRIQKNNRFFSLKLHIDRTSLKKEKKSRPFFVLLTAPCGVMNIHSQTIKVFISYKSLGVLVALLMNLDF